MQTLIPVLTIWIIGADKLRNATLVVESHLDEYNQEIHFESFLSFLKKGYSVKEFIWNLHYCFLTLSLRQTRKHLSGLPLFWVFSTFSFVLCSFSVLTRYRIEYIWKCKLIELYSYFYSEALQMALIALYNFWSVTFNRFSGVGLHFNGCPKKEN